MLNDELQDQLANVIRRAIDVAEAGGEFLAGELPDIAQQYVAWVLWSSAFAAVLATVLSGLAFYLGWKYREKSDYISLVPGSIIGAFATLPAAMYWMQVIKCIVAPKVVLIDWALELVR